MYTLTTNCKRQCWDPIVAAVSVLYTYVDHDLMNGLDPYTLGTKHEQDLVVVRHKRTSYTYAIACVLYSMYHDTSVHRSCATLKYVAKFLEQLKPAHTYNCQA